MTDFEPIAEGAVAASLCRHLAFYRHKKPTYQTVMLNSLLSVWSGPHEKLIDVGGGTGVIAQCMKEMFPVGSVDVVDVVDRFCTTLDVPTHVFDGLTLPFANGHFDAATINNVVHHIPIPLRAPLFRNLRQAVAGPLYIKDHEARSQLDHGRLAILDWLGNTPFSGMVQADYLTMDDWRSLASESGFAITQIARGSYRNGPFEALFPNRLELTMRWERV
ncbi:MAG: methyltransferase domain-containing protein [Acetobacteraceae bacterium]|nr:methyltransferase domain-containing protein [Acetobacteraceae bacterium]